MAYADQKASSSRIVAIIIVAAIHAVLGYAFVTGLAYQYVKQVQEKMTTFDVEEPPPPPEEEPPPPPPDQPVQPPPVVTPPPIVKTNVPPPVVVQSVRTPPAVYVPVPVAAPPAPPAPAPAPPAPPRVAKKLTPRGSPGSWVTNNDYPPAAIRAGEAGTTGFRLDVGPDGRVTGCTVTSSSGSSTLDDAACRLLQRRARFNPAEDASGNRIAATFASRFRWELPE